MRTRKLQSLDCYTSAHVCALSLVFAGCQRAHTQKNCKTLATTSAVQQIVFRATTLQRAIRRCRRPRSRRPNSYEACITKGRVSSRRSRRRFAGIKRVATRQYKWRKTYCDYRHGTGQTPRGSPLANAGGARHIATPHKHREGRHSPAHIYQNKLRLARRHAGNAATVITSAQNFEDAPRASATTRSCTFEDAPSASAIFRKRGGSCQPCPRALQHIN